MWSWGILKIICQAPFQQQWSSTPVKDFAKKYMESDADEGKNEICLGSPMHAHIYTHTYVHTATLTHKNNTHNTTPTPKLKWQNIINWLREKHETLKMMQIILYTFS